MLFIQGSQNNLRLTKKKSTIMQSHTEISAYTEPCRRAVIFI